ncbi:hypothetical protein AB0C65_13360 [Nocardia sp. NPDC048505]|uniref:hypothetical protein n=1 Tax=Nocardia sp. NPDC048505 TaxID=3155756 RepID=UPI0033C9A671
MTTPDDEARGNQVPGEPAPEQHNLTPEQQADNAFLQEFQQAFEESGEQPDVEFSLGESAPPPEPEDVDPAEQAREIGHSLARELATIGPQGWAKLEAVFVFTAVAEVAQIVFSDDEERSVRIQPPETVLELVRRHRSVSAELGDGPWWRLLLQLNPAGQLEIDYDYGDEPFPDDHLFPAEVYQADLAEYPRDRLPVWLAAYVAHGNRQSRTPAEAAAWARADREAGVRGTVSARDFPALPTLWARWSVLAAAFVAVGSEWGPRILPALGWFEGAKRGGSTLYMLPGGRAVLSGGVWNAPALDSAYNDGEQLPAYYAGAPAWVANPVLNPRAASGLLSFCYWWEGGRWYRGDSPTADQLAEAVPGIWTAQTVTNVIASLVSSEPSDGQVAAVATLVSAAEAGVVTRDTLISVFGDEGGFDIDSAFYQLTMAGVATTLPDPMPEDEAIEQVRRYILERDMDTTGYPLDQLRGDRISCGWMVYVPTAPGEIAIGRALFYIADDGVLEQSSSSIAPSRYIEEFEKRFQERNGLVDA